MIIRTISIVSRVRCTGRSNRTPCQPSITCGPLVPIPRINRPSDTCCTPCAVIASIAGVRAPSWAIPVARRNRSVTDAIAASGVNASNAQYSATHTESTPMRSACRATSRKRGIDGSTDNPIFSVIAASLPLEAVEHGRQADDQDAPTVTEQVTGSSDRAQPRRQRFQSTSVVAIISAPPRRVP